LSGAVCRELEAATGCCGSSVGASLVDAVTVVGLALSGAVCGELAGDAVPCRLSGALAAGEAGETIVESKVPEGAAAMIDLPSMLASWPAICRTRPLALAINPHTMKATTRPSFRCKLDHRPDSGCALCAEPMATPLSSACDTSAGHNHRRSPADAVIEIEHVRVVHANATVGDKAAD